MSFCSNCGTQKDAGAKFCPNCGQASSTNSSQTEGSSKPSMTGATHSTPSQSIQGNVKKEALQLSSFYFSTLLIEVLLMKFQSEGGWGSFANDPEISPMTYFIIFIAIYAIIFGLSYFAIRAQAINKGQTGWLLGLIIIFAAGTGYSWTSANFSNYNLADWGSEIVGLVQIYLMFAIYKLVNSAKPAQG